jgi:hypothetical protein
LAVITTVASTDLNVLFDGDHERIAQAVRAVVAKTLGLSAGSVMTDWYEEGNRLEVYAGGVYYTLTRTGIRASSSRVSVQADTNRLASALKALCGLVTQAKVAAALRARYQVTEERRLPTGQMVLTLEV